MSKKLRNIEIKNGKHYPFVNCNKQRIFANKYYNTGPITDPEKAVFYRNKLENELIQNTYSDKSKTLLKDFIFNDFLKHYEVLVKAKKRKPTYLYGMTNRLTVNIIPELGDRRIGTITTLDASKLQDKILSKGLKSMHKIVMDDLNKIMRKAEEWGFIYKAPKISIEEYAPEEKPFLTQKAMMDLLYALPIQDRCIIGLSCLDGLRRTEVFSLMWSDIDFENKMINIERQYIGKGQFITPKSKTSKKKIYAHELLLEWLEEYKEDGQFLFFESIAGRGKTKFYDHWLFPGRYYEYPLRATGWLQRRFKEIKREFNLPNDFTFHCFKHSFSTALAKNKERRKVTHVASRHTSQETTFRYYDHVEEEEMRNAINRIGKCVEFDIEKEKEKRVISSND